MSNLIDKNKTILLIVDIQDVLLPKIRFREAVINNTLKLIEYAKIADIPIMVTEQYPKGLGHTTTLIRNAIPDFKPIEKATFGCFGDKEFVKKLKKHKRDTLIVVGIETHVCICQTVLEAIEKYKVYVPVDAVSSQDKGDWATALQRMKDKGAEIVSTEMLIFELIQTAGTDEFKKILPYLKKSPKGKGSIVF
ncbi:MAG: hydrolase [Candidatus Eremiobacteraeota bacterium]|nr:hydrolase [Candidatus Eremiobacteraeota bacterium]